MRARWGWLLALVVLGGCNVSIPNGLFACGQPSDCPTGFFCWNSDSRCYDAKEPGCEPKTCELVIAEFGALGIFIECGSLPDGCDGTIECGGCPDGAACGANGQNFVCGCEENTCASYAGGAECGVVPTRCGGAEQATYCGSCIGNSVCQDNKCVCPPGVDCSEDCPGGEPTYPCSQNDCSPPEGLPDGCGGVAHCPSCSGDEDCVLSDDLRYQCLGDCTCEAQEIECGNATICGSPTACGSCADNGFEGGYRCADGDCICEDQYESNWSPGKAALICGDGAVGDAGVSCMQPAWTVDTQATLHSASDVDFYVLEVLNAPTNLVARVYNGESDHTIKLGYYCPNGWSGLTQCSSGETEWINGYEFCVSDGGTVSIERSCGSSGGSDEGEVFVAVAARVFRGDCDGYGLKVFATYEDVSP